MSDPDKRVLQRKDELIAALEKRVKELELELSEAQQSSSDELKHDLELKDECIAVLEKKLHDMEKETARLRAEPRQQVYNIKTIEKFFYSHPAIRARAAKPRQMFFIETIKNFFYSHPAMFTPGFSVNQRYYQIALSFIRYIRDNNHDIHPLSSNIEAFSQKQALQHVTNLLG